MNDGEKTGVLLLGSGQEVLASPPLLDRVTINHLLDGIEDQRAKGYVNLPYVDGIWRQIFGEGMIEGMERLMKAREEAEREGYTIGRVVINEDLYRGSGKADEPNQKSF